MSHNHYQGRRQVCCSCSLLQQVLQSGDRSCTSRQKFVREGQMGEHLIFYSNTYREISGLGEPSMTNLSFGLVGLLHLGAHDGKPRTDDVSNPSTVAIDSIARFIMLKKFSCKCHSKRYYDHIPVEKNVWTARTLVFNVTTARLLAICVDCQRGQRVM
jgi:hypothetical protein